MRPEQIPYGVKDFKRVRLENFYYVDKSAFIEKLEQRANFLFFVRPRRFGKSMLCEMLRCYCDVAEKGNFLEIASVGLLYCARFASLAAANPPFSRVHPLKTQQGYDAMEYPWHIPF